MTDANPTSAAEVDPSPSGCESGAIEVSPSSTGTTIATLMTVAIIGWANRTTVSQWFTRWIEETSVGAGYVLVAAAGWIAFRDRGLLTRVSRPRVIGLFLIYLGFVGKLAGQMAVMPIPDRLGFYLQIVGVLILWYGLGGLVAYWRPALLLLAAVPLPVSVQSRIDPGLGEAGLIVIGPLVEIAGLTVTSEQGGMFTAFDGTQEYRLEAIEMPFYFAALALVVGCLRRRGLVGLAVLGVGALPVLIACNAARSVLAGLAATDVSADGAMPHLLRWLMLPVALAVLVGIDRLLPRHAGSESP